MTMMLGILGAIGSIGSLIMALNRPKPPALPPPPAPLRPPVTVAQTSAKQRATLLMRPLTGSGAGTTAPSLGGGGSGGGPTMRPSLLGG